jgi:hypothetical protein
MTKEVLQNYIENRIKSGEDYSIIKEDLKSRGYSDNEIDEAFDFGHTTEEEHVLKINENQIHKKKFSFDFLKKYEHYKRFIFPAFIILITLIGFQYSEKFKEEQFTNFILVGSIYLLVALMTSLIQTGIIVNVVVSSRRKEDPGLFKTIFSTVIVSHLLAVFILPMTMHINILIPIAFGTLLFTIICLVFLNFNIHELISSVVTYALISVLVLILIKDFYNFEFIIGFLTG